VNKLALPSPKSAGFREVLGAFGWEGALMIGGAEEEVWDTSLMLASRNFPFVDFIPAEEADVLRILKHERVVMDEEALAILVERLSVE
jgi:ribosomal protein L4